MKSFKFTPAFWNRFAKQEHYFKDVALLEDQKLSGYLGFLKDMDLADGLLLKTDLYVESKNKKDNFLPYLKINRCVGMDISFEIVRSAKKNLKQSFPNMKFVVADVRHLPFQKSSFDAVLSDSTLDHIPKDDVIGALSETERILNDKGALIVAVNNVLNPISLYDRTIKNYLLGDNFISFFYSPGRILWLLKKIGLNAVRRDHIIIADPLMLLLAKFPHDLKRVGRLATYWLTALRQLSRISLLKRFVSLQFIIFAEKQKYAGQKIY